MWTWMLSVDVAPGACDQGSSSSLPAAMMSTDSSGIVVLESSGEQPSTTLDPLSSTHLPGKATPSGGRCTVFTESGSKVTANGLHDIEDRILRITGYYGYNPGYSSHRSE